MAAAVRGNLDQFCMEMKHMREYVRRAYEALPKYYKDRYEVARQCAFDYHTQAMQDLTGR